MGERLDTNPNTTLNGYIMELWKFDLTYGSSNVQCNKNKTKRTKKKPQKNEDYPQP